MVENKVTINIDSFFNDRGFKKAMTQLDRLNAISTKASNAFSGASALDSVIDSTNAFAKYSDELNAVGAQLRKNGQIWKDGKLVKSGKDFKELASKVNDYRQSQFELGETQKKVAKFNEKIARTSWLAGGREGLQMADAQGIKGLQKWSMAAKGASTNFDMAALSSLFFGMQIMNLGRGIASSTIGTFKQLTDQNSSSVQSLNKLSAGFTVLKYAIGEALMSALEPFIPTLLNALEAMIDFIDRNQGFVAAIVGSAIAIGAALFLFGSLQLGISGVLGALGKIGDGITKLMDTAKWASTNFPTLMKGLTGVVGGALAVSAVIDSFQILTKDGTTVWDYAKMAGKGVLAGILLGSLVGAPVVGGIIALGTVAAIIALDLLIEADKKKVDIQTKNIVDYVQKSLDNSGRVDPTALLTIASASDDTLFGSFADTFGKGKGDQLRKVLKEYRGIISEENLPKINEILGTSFDLTTFNQRLAESSAKLKETTDTIQTTAEILQQNPFVFADIITDTDKQKIDDISIALDNLVLKINGMDLTKLSEASIAFTRLSESLGGDSVENNLVMTLHEVADAISGPSDSVSSGLSVMITKMAEAQSTIDSVLVPALITATVALRDNAGAASSAASAQERYNKAVKGTSK